MDSDFGSDGYSFEEGVRTPSAGERVRSFFSPLGKKFHIPSSPTSPSPTSSPRSHLVDDTLRPILEVKDKIVDSCRRYAEKRAQQKEELRVKRAWEAKEIARIRAIVNLPCPVQLAKEDRAHERLGRERRELVGKFKAKAEKREREAAKLDERIRKGMAKVTVDRTGIPMAKPPSIKEYLEVNGFVHYPGEGIRQVRLSQIA